MKNLPKLNTNLDLSQLENPKSNGISSLNEESLGKIGKSKIDALKKSILEINEMIKSRENLSNQVHSEAESLKTEILGYLKENERVQITSSDPVREKNDLRHKKIEVAESQITEKISCWKDIALLKRERREYERELTEKEDRLSTLSKLMEDTE